MPPLKGEGDRRQAVERCAPAPTLRIAAVTQCSSYTNPILTAFPSQGIMYAYDFVVVAADPCGQPGFVSSFS